MNKNIESIPGGGEPPESKNNVERPKKAGIEELPESAIEQLGPESVVGLSLSLCVKDIAEGKISEDAVKEIVSSTAAQNDEGWDEIFERYKKAYWEEFPEEAEAIARRLLADGKISQPRLEGKGTHMIKSGASGLWKDADTFKDENLDRPYNDAASL